jgi:hypothetical protein
MTRAADGLKLFMKKPPDARLGPPFSHELAAYQTRSSGFLQHILDVNTVRLVLEGLGFDHDLTVLQNARQAIAFLNRDEPYNSAVHPDLILLGLRASDTDGAAP